MSGIRFLRSFDVWFFLFAGFLIIRGLSNREHSFLTAESGTGYMLGIVGVSMMLLLMLYPVRKHVKLFRSAGPMKYWFRIHMLLGVAGPVLILFHANFGLGSTNSNIALFCMLIVAGSGLFGRLFYSKIHHGLYGRKIELTELRDALDEIKADLGDGDRLHQLLSGFEKKVLKHRMIIVAAINMLFMRLSAGVMKFKLAAILRKSETSNNEPQQKRIAQKHINRYINHILRVADFTVYERLFSLWHVLHIPLFLMMVISGIVHVFAVHIY